MGVKVGDREVVIEPFKGYKGARAGRLFGRISRHWPEIVDKMADFRREYGEKHYRRITRAMAETRSLPEQVTDDELTDVQRAAVQAVADRTAAMYRRLLEGELKEKPHVDLPEVPSQAEQVAAVFGDVFEVAERELLELLALLITPNRDLKRAYKDGGEEAVDALLKETGEDLLFDADLEDLVALAVEGYEVLGRQLDVKGAAMGKLMSLFNSGGRTTSEQPQPAETTAEETNSTSLSTFTSPDSSTDSPAPTDGAPSESSSELAGVSSPS